MNILYLGQGNDTFSAALEGLGPVSYASTPSDLAAFDLIAVDCQYYQGDYLQLLRSTLEAGASLGLINITDKHAAVVTAETGVAPGRLSEGVIVGAMELDGQQFRQVKFLPKYPENVLEEARKLGMDTQQLINSFIQMGIQSHFDALNNAKNATLPGNQPPTNNLIPAYSQAPFSIYNMAPKALSIPVSNMKNLSAVSMAVSAQLYCYNENNNGNNDFIVIIVAQLNNIPYGNPLTYSESDMPSCGSCVYSYEWDQYFQYSLKTTPLDQHGNPIVNGLTVYNSSPAPAGHGPTSVVDSIGVPNPFTIFLTVNSGGSWIPVNFQASYLNTIQMDTLKWFDISSLDNLSGGVAGVEFNMPTNITGWYQGQGTPAPVQFEVTSIFRFASSLVTNNQLNVIFNLAYTMGVTQNYVTSVQCSPNPVYPTTTTTYGGGTSVVQSELLNLVALTQPH